MDISLGKWVDGYDSYLLMKFTSSEEFQNDFLDGKLYFNTSDYFAACDDKGRGDPDEGSTFIINNANPNLVSAGFEVINGELMLVVRDYSKNPSEYRRGSIQTYSAAENRNRKIICLYTCYINIKEHIVSQFPLKMGMEFGEYGVIILDRKEFFKRVNNAIKKYELRDALMGFVEYEEMNPGLNDWHPFRKDKEKYSYQNEFRITFLNNDNKPYNLNLGCSLRDIAVPILASDVKEIYFENGLLLYPAYEVVSK